MREYYGRRYDTEKKRSPEKTFDETMTTILTEQRKDQELVKTQKALQAAALKQQETMENIAPVNNNIVPINNPIEPTDEEMMEIYGPKTLWEKTKSYFGYPYR